MLTLLIACVGLGIVAGMRTTLAPTAVSWTAYLGGLNLGGTWLAFLGSAYAPWILSLCLVGELIGDKLPFTPSRKLPGPFVARLVSGGICGLALGYAGGVALIGALICALGGIVGAVIGTLGGYTFRAWLAAALKRDFPAALIEDAIALAGAFCMVVVLLVTA
ncbi:MAG TPA: DUF4126 domain-containing protein [Xanthobacteraceae bacterium]|nr:DUF4126 domain-containing protein [Xanthobacteraceae bacterium]